MSRLEFGDVALQFLRWNAQTVQCCRYGVAGVITDQEEGGVLRAGDLADWILEDQLEVRLQVQLHKALWGDVAGR